MTKTVKFKKLGYGFLSHTHNDGRAKFSKNLKEAKVHELFGIEKGFVIQQIDCPHGDNYGLTLGKNEVDALEKIQEIYDENTGEDDEKFVCEYDSKGI